MASWQPEHAEPLLRGCTVASDWRLPREPDIRRGCSRLPTAATQHVLHVMRGAGGRRTGTQNGIREEIGPGWGVMLLNVHTIRACIRIGRHGGCRHWPLRSSRDGGARASIGFSALRTQAPETKPEGIKSRTHATLYTPVYTPVSALRASAHPWAHPLPRQRHTRVAVTADA